MRADYVGARCVWRVGYDLGGKVILAESDLSLGEHRLRDAEQIVGLSGSR